MPHLIDKTDLERQLKWKTTNFDQAVARLRELLQDFDRKVDYALERIDYSHDGIVGPFTHADAAAQISGDLQWACANTDLRGLIDSAAEVAVQRARIETLALIEAEYPEAYALIKETEDKRREKRDSEVAEREAKRQAEIANLCQCQVHIRGRGVGFRQCTKPSKWEVEHGGKLYRSCTTHKDDFKPYRERDESLDIRPRGGDAS